MILLQASFLILPRGWLDHSVHGSGYVLCCCPRPVLPRPPVCWFFILLKSNLKHFIRVYKLTNSIPVVAVLCLLSLLGFVFGVYAGVDSGVINQYDIFRFELHNDLIFFFLRVKNFAPLTPFVICWLGFSTAADLSITRMNSFIFQLAPLFAHHCPSRLVICSKSFAYRLPQDRYDC